MKYLKIANWDVWQTYRKDRAQPQWIKVHRALLRNLEWHALTDSQKGQLVSIWMLAADRDGEIPNDPAIIKRFCGLEDDPDLEALEALGFISGCHAANHDGNQPPTIMTAQKREDETRTDHDGGQIDDKKKAKKKTPKKDDGSTETAQKMADEFNRIFGTDRKPTTSLVSAIKAVLKNEKGTTPEDFALVVKSRSTETWVIEQRPPIESMIRADKFAGNLEKAKELDQNTRPSKAPADVRKMFDDIHGGTN